MPRFNLARYLLIPVAILLLSSHPLSVWAGSFEMGMSAYQEKDYPTAIRLFKQAVSENLNNPNIRYYLADSLLKNNRLGEAQVEYNQILALAPDTQAARLSQQALAQLKDFAFRSSGRLQTIGNAPGQAVDKLVGLNAGEDNYLDEITNGGKYVRWSLVNPLKIYVERAPKGINHFESGYIATVPRAMQAWSSAMGGQLHYIMVNSPEQADITVGWVNSIDQHGFVKDNTISFTAGLTTPNIESGQLRTMRVRIATLDIQNNPQNQDGVYHTVVHELGHALGLLGHSTDEHDLMSVQQSEEEALTSLSKRDINTIRKLYQLTPDITNAPPAPNQKKSPEDSQRIARAIDHTIERYEAQTAKLGNALTWTNLGVNYAKKAAIIKDLMAQVGGAKGAFADPKNQPPFWYQKSLDAYSKALALEPQNIYALSRRATVYSDIGMNDKGLADISAAIKLAPKEPDFYLIQAEMYLKAGKKFEASNSLATFRQLAPNALTSTAYKFLSKQL